MVEVLEVFEEYGGGGALAGHDFVDTLGVVVVLGLGVLEEEGVAHKVWEG